MEGAVRRRRTWLFEFLKDGFRNWKSSSWQDKYAKAYAPIASVAKTIGPLAGSRGPFCGLSKDPS